MEGAGRKLSGTMSSKDARREHIKYLVRLMEENRKDRGRRTSVYTGVYKSKLVVDEDLIKEMECPVCYKHMVSEIFICVSGHSLCSECRSQGILCPLCRGRLSPLRNYLAESISSKLPFPCVNADAGCTEIIPGKDVKNHQSQCPKREYQCFMHDCQWVGRNNCLLSHFKDEHNDNLRLGNEHSFTWTIAQPDIGRSKPNRVCYLIVVNEGLFIHSTEHNAIKTVFAFCVQYIGPIRNASNFYYTLELVKDDHHKAVFTDSVLDDTKTAKAVFYSGESLEITYPFLKRFMNKESKVVQKVNILSKK